jgi:S-adenosylmethionine hydrolase
MKRIAPGADVIDITHGIAPRDVQQGALVLASSLPYTPEGVHVAVVDPGVGSERRGLALRGGDGRLYVGPDNGLLLLAADSMGGGVDASVALENEAFFLTPVSPTFHGRDVFSPVAAHLAVGVPLEELGPAIDAGALRRLELPEPAVDAGRARAVVLAVDRFGNVQLNVRGVAVGDAVELCGRTVRVGRTFADVSEGEPVVFEDSYGWLAIAVNGGSAADLLGLRRGDELSISWR